MVSVTRSRVIKMGAGSLVTLALAACGWAGGEGGTAKSARQVTLTHWGGLPRTHPSGEAHFGTIEEYAQELLDKYGIRTNLETADTEKIIIASAGGTPPHTAWHGYGDAARIFVTGATVAPDEELKRERDWAAQRKDIYPALLESSLWKGKLTSIPIEANNRGIYYDKAILAKIGLAPPTPNWTHAEFNDKITRATAPPDRWGFTITPNYLDYLIFYGGAGGKIFNADFTRWTVDNALGRDTLQYLHDLVYKRQVIPAPPPGELMNRGEGRVAFDITGNFRYPTYRQRGVDVGAAPMPFNKVKFTIAHGWNVSAFKNSDAHVQHTAAQFIMWLTSPRFSVPYLIKSDNVPASRAALEHKDFQAYLAKDPVIRVFAEQAPHQYRIPATPSGDKSWQALGAWVRKALLNEVGISEALTQGQRDAQLIWDEDLRR